MSLTLDSLLEKLSGVRKSGSAYMARCPAHEDTNPSLSITEREGKILLKCQGGCETARVCEHLGIEMSDLFLDGAKRNAQRKAENLSRFTTTRTRLESCSIKNSATKTRNFRFAVPPKADGKIISMAQSACCTVCRKFSPTMTFSLSRAKKTPTPLSMF